MRGDFGRSHTTQQSVASAVLPCILVTLELAVLSIVLAALAAVVTNTLPAGRRVLGPVVVVANLIGITVPNFMLGISLIFIFSVGLGWLPSTGWMPWSSGVLVHLKHMILPVLTLSAYYFGVFSIVYRAEYRDVQKRLFIQAARAKGISRSRVAFRHALPNAILPVITFVGLSMGQLTGGAVVTETVFSMPGMGRLLVSSISSHDFPVMLAIAMMIVIGVVLMNLLADIAYTVANPQIRIDEGLLAGQSRQAGLFGEGTGADDRVVPPIVALRPVPPGHAMRDHRAVNATGELLHAREQAGAVDDGRQRLDQADIGVGFDRVGQTHDGVAGHQAVRVQDQHVRIAAAETPHPFGDVAGLAFAVVRATPVEDTRVSAGALEQGVELGDFPGRDFFARGVAEDEEVEGHSSRAGCR